MSSCSCENPSDFRVTYEAMPGDDMWRIRCAECGGKYGSVHIDFLRQFADPNNTDEGEVTIKISDVDNPFWGYDA